MVLLGQREVRRVISAQRAVTARKHVFSHISILGNERADRLARQLKHPFRMQFLRLTAVLICSFLPWLVGWQALGTGLQGKI